MVATLFPQTNLPGTPSYTEGKTLKAKSEGYQDGVIPKGGTAFSSWEPPMEVGYSLHATTHLGEKALQRLLERSFRGTGLQMTIRQVVSSFPTCQLNNAQRARRPQLVQPVQKCETYQEEDWQMNFTQMPVSQGYKYLLVMIDTLTGWIEVFPTLTEKACCCCCCC